MCGLTGFVHADSGNVTENNHILEQMTDSLSSRGPDDSGTWSDQERGIYIGHRRLSIIDTSTGGRQPMISASGRLVIAYNGEIYNYRELRQDLEANGIRFRTRTDTEVLLEACDYWGLEKTVSRLIGMFAFCLWDNDANNLFLVRDRLGIKPLYWGRFGGLFLFGSELKALRCHPSWQPEINRESLASYLRFNCIPAPQSIYHGVHKLEPGCILEFNIAGKEKIQRYWEMPGMLQTTGDLAQVRDEDDTVDFIEDLLLDAVNKRMVSDVPLGVFLSGGIDSSIVTAMMQKSAREPIRSFSVGYEDVKFNEAHFAGKIAEHLGTKHTEFCVTHEDGQKIIPLIPEIYDEPFSDSSQIPTTLISKLTREHVTVALSGDGGDEVFGGYSRYLTASKYEKLLFETPKAISDCFAKAIRLFTPDQWDRINAVTPEILRTTHLGDKLYKLTDILGSGRAGYYSGLVSHWTHPEEVVFGASGETPAAVASPGSVGNSDEFIAWMQCQDAITYLPNDILTKLDRASMSVSLEARVPLLDHRLIEAVSPLPMKYKIRAGKGKWLLRKILSRHVPESLFDRPKRGFGVPIGNWLRGPLRDWAESLLDEYTLDQQGYFNSKPIRQKWSEHLSGKRNWEYHLWDILVYQAWLARWQA